MTSSKQSRMVELSNIISQNTSVLDQYIQESGIPQPSFALHEPAWDNDFPPEIQSARIAIQDATSELSELTLGTYKLLNKALFNSVTDFQTIHRLAIPRLIPLDEPNGISYTELCSRIEVPVDENALIRILRAAIVFHIFREPSPGRIAHSAVSSAMVTKDVLFDWVGASVDVMLARQYMGRAMEKWPELDEATRTGASLAFSRQRVAGDEAEYIAFYDYLAQDPKRAKMFGRSTSFFQSGEDLHATHLVEGFNWSSLPQGSTVVDVGGSHGDVAIAIARKHAGLQLVVQDLPNTVASASAAKKLVDEECLNVRFMAHNFFDPQPIKHAQVYILRWILHNWPDKYCVQILQSLIPAMEKGSKVLIQDDVMPELGTVKNVVEREMRFSDITMLSCFNAADREAGQYEKILRDAGLRFNGCRKGVGSRLSIIEGVWEG